MQYQDPDKPTLQIIEPKEPLNLARYAHSSVIHSHQMYIFGGEIVCDTPHEKCNDLHVYSLETGSFQKIHDSTDETGDNIPAKRSSHTSVVYNNGIYVFGGSVEDAKLHCFDLEKQCWRRIETTNTPDNRFGHSCVVWKDSFIIYSGKGFKYGTRNGCFAFCFKTNTWKQITQKGDIPAARFYHSAVVYEPRNEMVIFGGFSCESACNDIYAFDLVNKTWRSIAVYGTEIPSPRYGHSSCIYGNSMFIYGGGRDSTKWREIICNGELYEFSFQTQTWKLILIGPARIWHSCCRVGHQLIIFGGLTKNKEGTTTLSKPTASNCIINISLNGHLNMKEEMGRHLKRKKYIDLIIRFN